jgi:TatD DNase family protein
MIDTHAHLYAEAFEGEIDEVISRAKAAGVTKILLPNIDIDSIAGLNKLVELDSTFFIE